MKMGPKPGWALLAAGAAMVASMGAVTPPAGAVATACGTATTLTNGGAGQQIGESPAVQNSSQSGVHVNCIYQSTEVSTAYTLHDAPTLARLDPFRLLLVEQPLDEEDVRGHAELARRIRTPICLDESIVSARAAADAIALGACSIVNVKPGRVGGYLESRRIHDVCAASGVAVWCGGMLETGVGRAANVALAALPGFTLPGDTSASDRYYRTDITEPFVIDTGHLRVPTGPGLGVIPIPEALDAVTVGTEWLPIG